MWSASDLLTFSFYSAILYLIYYYIRLIYENIRIFKFSYRNNGFFYPILPVIGTCYLAVIVFFTSGRSVSTISILRWMKKNIGYPMNFWLRDNYYYVTINPVELQAIVNHPKCYNKGDIIDYVRVVEKSISNTLGFARYNIWKPKRKYLQNSYKPAVLKSYVPTFYKQSCNLIEYLQNMDESEDLFHVFSNFSFDNFFLTSAGMNEENFEPEFKSIGEIFLRMQENISTKVVLPFVPFPIWKKVFPAGIQFSQDVETVKTIIGKLIKQKQRLIHDDEENNPDDVTPLFDSMMNTAASKMTYEEITNEIGFFTAAASETSGSALTFCFALLGMYPDVQDRLYQEVMDQLGNTELVHEDLANLKYTEAVILETLRLFPSIPFTTRRVGEDVEVDSLVIPKGTNFVIDAFHMHRNEEYWPNPLEFDPCRFLPENASKIKPYTYIPFSSGPRDCIGKGQAIMLMKTTVACVVRKFNITSNHKSTEEFVLQCTITMKTVNHIDCHFSPRE